MIYQTRAEHNIKSCKKWLLIDVTNMYDLIEPTYESDWQLTWPFITEGLCKHLFAWNLVLVYWNTYIYWHLLLVHGIRSEQYLRYTITKTTRHMSPLRTSKCLDMYSLASHYRLSAVDYIDDLRSNEFFWWKNEWI